MANFNKVIIAGNLTRDPELKFTPKGTAVCKLGIAINREWKSETGEKKQETTFVDVDAFGKTAEVIAQYLKKGRPILLEGRLRTDSWEDKQTAQKRSRLGVVLESFQFIDSKSEKSDAPTASTPASAAPATATTKPADDSDVPF